jgi:glucosamine--fructose-6-phosphate aminotransferase (isomerizing)
MTMMAQETKSIPEVVAAQLDKGLFAYKEAGANLAGLKPATLVTCARGSSDHAAHYFKYLVEMKTGVPVASVGPSISSIYQSPLQLQGIPVLAISQSGGSHDLSVFMNRAVDCGAHAYALTNDTTSLLAESVQNVLPMHAGPEHAVAATKTFVTSLVAGAAMVGAWSQDDALLDALHQLPEQLRRAADCDWGHALDKIGPDTNLFAVSRGPAFAVAGEIALKFKETCLIHAEAFSAAEVKHGPMALAASDLTALVLHTRDAGHRSVQIAAQAMEEAGATILSTDPNRSGGAHLAVPYAGHPLLDPICQIVSFYGFVEQLSRRLGYNPDAPPLLNKVTVTL